MKGCREEGLEPSSEQQPPGGEVGLKSRPLAHTSFFWSLQVGDFVLFGTYIIQLYMPLNWFGTYYR